MAAETLQRLLKLIRDGASVVFLDGLPADVPGFSRLEERRAQLKEVIAQVKFTKSKDADWETAVIGSGAIARGSLAALEQKLHRWREPLADQGISLVRRMWHDEALYFLVNQSGQPVDGWVSLRQSPYGLRPASMILLDPRSGKIGRAVARVSEEKNGILSSTATR